MGLPVEVNNLMIGGDAGYRVERSLRVRRSASAYLSRSTTFQSANSINTFSFWFKRGVLGSDQYFYEEGPSVNDRTYFHISSSDSLRIVQVEGGSTTLQKISTQVFRDPGAWYHLVVVFNRGAATAEDRVLAYVNGNRITAWSTNTIFSSTGGTYISGVTSYTRTIAATRLPSLTATLDGYLAEFNFIDGQALTPSSFAQTDPATGVWVPKEYRGTYGTNGFYIPFTDNSSILALGLDASNSGTPIASATGALPILNTDSTGYTVLSGVRSDSFASSLRCAVAIGGTSSLNITDQMPTGRTFAQQTITNNSSVSNNTTAPKFYGGSGYFNTNSLTVPGAVPNVGTGNFTCEMWFKIDPTATSYRGYGRTSLFNANESTTGSALGVVLQGNTVGASGLNVYIAGTTPISYTTAITQNVWTHVAVSRSGTTVRLFLNGTQVASGTSSASIGNVNHYVGAFYASEFIYSDFFYGWITDFRFYGTAKYTSNFTVPVRNDWWPTNVSLSAGSTYDSMLDSPTNYDDGGNGRGNYCVGNTLIRAFGGYTPMSSPRDGNLSWGVPSNASLSAGGTFVMRGGKWYWECTLGGSMGNYARIGIAKTSVPNTNAAPTGAGTYYYLNDGQKTVDGTNTAYGSSFTVGDTIAFALDLTNGQFTCYKNGVSQGVLATVSTTDEYLPFMVCDNTGSSFYHSMNFGQRPYLYTPPSGFKALNTQNLPDPAIKKGSAYFDATTYTGTGSSLAISSLNFQPDLVWIKKRNSATDSNNIVTDAVRGIPNILITNATNAESNIGTEGVQSFNSNGFTLGARTSVTGDNFNANGSTYVGWSWDEGATPGFDIVTYTGTGVNRTVAHSLGAVPQFIVVKQRNTTGNWVVYTSTTGAGNYLLLNSTQASDPATNVWNSTAPTSSVFSLGTNTAVNTNGGTYVAYLWSEVPGFSRFGSYVGNGSSDGTFVWLGFRPAFFLVKAASGGTAASQGWAIADNKRNGYNLNDYYLFANSNAAEGTGNNLDLVSNGVKMRGGPNENGTTYVYAAFAENPFKIARAR